MRKNCPEFIYSLPHQFDWSWDGRLNIQSDALKMAEELFSNITLAAHSCAESPTFKNNVCKTPFLSFRLQ